MFWDRACNMRKGKTNRRRVILSRYKSKKTPQCIEAFLSYNFIIVLYSITINLDIDVLFSQYSNKSYSDSQ